jgi:hypothetical protein
MTRDYDRILKCARETPAANEQLVAALTYVELGEFDLMRLHAAAAADVLVNRFPDLGDPIVLAAVLTAAFLQHERLQAAAPLN